MQPYSPRGRRAHAHAADTKRPTLATASVRIVVTQIFAEELAAITFTFVPG